jgi:hypothetical protein
MQGTPEGTDGERRPAHRVWVLLIAVIFAGYLGLRLVQGVVWVVQHV